MAPLASVIPLSSQEDMVTVLVPENPAEQKLAEAVLEEAGISFLVKNADLQNLYGTGEVGLHNPMGSIEVQVAGGEADRAGRLLADALTPADSEAFDERAAALEARFRRDSTRSLVCGVFWLGGIGSVLAIYFGLKALSLRREAPALPKSRPVFGLALGLAGLAILFLEWGLPLFR